MGEKEEDVKLSEAERALFSKLGRRGGKMRMIAMTPEQRTELARKAVNSRWAKDRDKPKTKTKAKSKTKVALKAA